MEPFSPSVHDDPRHLSLSLSLPLWFSPLVRPVPVAVYKSGRRLYPPTTLHRMEQRGGGYRGGPEEGGGVRGHTIRVPTASGVTRCCNLRRIVAEIRDWNRGRVMNRTDVFPALFQFPFAVSVFFFFFFFLLIFSFTLVWNLRSIMHRKEKRKIMYRNFHALKIKFTILLISN